jgi:TfoX/Sxy family transcriptional regulator of competence genes
MAYNEKLADRIRAELGQQDGLSEKKMFGGYSFLLNGNMCCGVHGDEMIVRLAPNQTEAALSKQHTRIFDMTGRPMKGWILVHQDGLKTKAELVEWIQLGVEYASSLPAK